MKIFKKMKKGFTLVELVVVIAVIAILAAVSVGAYFGVTESANKSRLEQESKQVYTAIQTVALAPNEHSDLSSSGLTIKDSVAFKSALVENLGKDVALIDEQNNKDDNVETICFYAENQTNTLLGDKKYNFFEYHIPSINGKKGVVNVITGEVDVIETSAKGEEIPDPITSVEEALSAKKGLTAILDGTVVRISDEWDDTEECMSFILEDENGKSIEVYKCKTQVVVGDIVTVTGKIGQYSGKNQIAAGSSAKINGHDTSKDEIVYITSISEALVAADNAHVKVIGTVVSIETEYSSQYGNISLTIADNQGNRLSAYRVYGNAELNNIVEITGQMTTYKGNRQIAEKGTLEVKEGAHTCTNFTEADCENAAKCIVCGKENGTKLICVDSNNDGVCDNCNSAMNIITVKTILSEYAEENNWVICSGNIGTPSKTLNMDENITVNVKGGTNSGKYYSDGWRIYASDTPAGSLTFTALEGYEFKAITINALSGEYANLYLQDTSSDVKNTEVEVSGSTVLFNTEKNGTNGKRVVITSIIVKYVPVEISGSETPDVEEHEHDWNSETGECRDQNCGEICSHPDVVEGEVCPICGYQESNVKQEKKYKYTFEGKQFASNETKTLDGFNWTLSGDGGYWSYDGTKGQQFGSSGNPYKSMTLSTDGFEGKEIKSVVINTSGASSINGSFTLKINGSQIGSTTKLTTTATDYTFEPAKTCNSLISFEYTQTSSKAIYIKSIEITYVS